MNMFVYHQGYWSLNATSDTIAFSVYVLKNTGSENINMFFY